ncbi:MAG: GxxExxY protein [Colwellia sp.]|nr:GxxExxY protein [Colwellia sp.]
MNNENHRCTQLNTDKNEFLYKEDTHCLIGCAMEVINALGQGLLEKPYENALVVEFQIQSIPFQQQPRFPVFYKTVRIGEYIPDLIAFDKIIIDTKTVEHIGNIEIGQMINYLKITGLKVGLIINFKHPKLEWKRVVL